MKYVEVGRNLNMIFDPELITKIEESLYDELDANLRLELSLVLHLQLCPEIEKSTNISNVHRYYET